MARSGHDGGDDRASSPDVGSESTVGTGSAVAVGCTLASLLVILLGVGILVLVRLL